MDACRYPAWLLAALLVSFYLLLHHFVRAVLWCDTVGSCLQDWEACLADSGNRQAACMAWRSIRSRAFPHS